MDDLDLETPPPESAAPAPPPPAAPTDMDARLREVSQRNWPMGFNPAGMVEAHAVPIKSEEEYAALAPGSHFIRPDGKKAKKPWYVTDDASYDAVPEGEVFIADGKRLQKPKYDDLPYGVQTLYNMAVNDKERLKILEQAYPGRVKGNARGELYVEEEGGKRRKSRGFSESPGAFLTAEAAPAIGGVLGELGGASLGHRVVPFVGGMIGGIGGGGAGAAGGQVFNDTIMRLTGNYDRTTEEAVGRVGESAAWGAGGSAAGRVLLPMVPNLYRYGKNAFPGAAAKFFGAAKADVDMAVDIGGQAKALGIEGPIVPPSTVLKHSPGLHQAAEVLEPAIYTEGRLDRAREAFFEKKGGNILKDLGVEEPGSLLNPTAAVPMEEAGVALQARARQQAGDALAASDAQLAEQVAETRARLMAEDVVATMDRPSQEALERAVATNQAAAQRVLDDGFQQIQADVNAAMRAADADVNSGGLWRQVATRLRELRQAVVTRHRNWYQQADEIAGDTLPDIGNLPETAGQFLAHLPEGFEGQYPTIVQRIRDLAGRRNPETGEWIVEPANPTFGQLHELRTHLRNDVDWYRLNSTLDDGVNKYFNNQIDDILHNRMPDGSPNPNVPENLQIASSILDSTDRSYGASMRIYNDTRLNSVIGGLKSGVPADADELFNVIVRSGRSDLTNWVREHVGPTLWNAVRAADVHDLIQGARNLDGTIDGSKFVADLLRRHRNGMLEPVHGANAQRLIDQARRIQIADGSLTVPVREGDTLSEIMGRVRAAQEAASARAAASPLDTLADEIRLMERQQRAATATTQRNDPLRHLLNPTVGATEAVERILAKPDLIFEVARRFGDQSQEFNMLRQIYAQRFLRGSPDPSEKLGKISPELQELMFPGISTEQMQLFAKEMRFLLGARVASSDVGGSMQAQHMVSHPRSQLANIVKDVIPALPLMGPVLTTMLGKYFGFLTNMSAHPVLHKILQKGLEGSEAEKFTARNMLKAMAFGKGANRGGAMGAGVGGGVGATPDTSGRISPATIEQMRAAQ